MRSKNAAGAVSTHPPRRPHAVLHGIMSARALLLLLAVACACRQQPAEARPVRHTLNFNMFVLEPKEGDGGPERTVLTTDGISRFGPVIEYLVQRVQGLMSVRNSPEPIGGSEPAEVNATENEVDGSQESRTPAVVVRPSATRPGTYEVQVDVLLDDGPHATPPPANIS